MKKLLIIIFVLVGCNQSKEIPQTAKDFLERSIAYHDPNGNWAEAEFKLIFSEIDATRIDLERSVSISNKENTFAYYQKDEEKELSYILDKDSCKILLNGSENYSEEERDYYQLNCGQARLLRDFYTYLYGLPMKLKDPGTIIHDEVIEEEFNGKSYYSIRVTYDEKVGKDLWYFYLDKETYGLRGYRFQHNLVDHDGEYITLDGLEEYDGMRIPKTRTWYVNKTGEYLATDELESIERL